MVKFRPTAALSGLILAVAMPAGAFAYPAATRPAPAPPPVKLSRAVMRVAVIRHYGLPGNASGYSVIIAAGRGQAWAFGGTDPGGPSAPVAARWNGSTLTPSPLPAGLTGFISDASAPAPTNVWAAGQYGRYVLHWTGRRWLVAGVWRHGQITGMTAISATDVWVFGTTISGSRVLGSWHFDGSTWSQVHGPGRSIYRASAASRRDIWAIGASPQGDLILRYDGRSWRPVPTGRTLAGVEPRDILAISRHDVWVTGNQVGPGGSTRLVLAHWNGIRWSRLVSGLDAWAGRLAPGPQGDVLLTATPADAAATGLILRASSQGWGPTIVVQSSLGSGVSDVALAPGTWSLWATGGILTRLGGDAAIWSGPIARADSDADHL